MSDTAIKFLFTEQGMELLKQKLTSLGDSLGKLKTAALGIGAVFAGGAFLGKAISEAIEAEDNVKKLGVALQAAGTYTKDSVKKFQEFASTLQDTTRFSDDAALSSLTLLRKITNLSNNGIKQATLLAADLAATFGIDLAQATEVLGKAINGQTRGLKQFGITIKDAGNETDNFNNIQKALVSFQGNAQKDTETYSGKMEVLSNKLGEAYEAIGKLIINNRIFSAALNLTIGSIDALNSALETTTQFVDFLGESWDNFFNNKFSFKEDNIKALEEITKQILETEQALSSFSEGTKAYDNARAKLGNLNEEYKKIKDSLEKFRTSSQDTGNSFVTDNKKSKRSLEEINPAIEKLKSTLDKLREKFKFGGMSDVEKVKAETKETLNILEDLKKKKIVQDEEYQNLKHNIVLEGENKILKIKEESDRKAAEDAEKRLVKLQEFYVNMFNQFSNVVGAAEGGAEGARSLVTSLPAAIGSVWGPIGSAIGGFIGKILSIVSMTKEVMRERITQFMNALPEIAQRMAENLPILMEVIAQNLPIVTRAAIKSMPAIAKSFFDFILKASPTLVTAMVSDFTTSIPNMINAWVKYMASSSFYKDLTNAIIEGVKGSAQSFAGNVGDAFGSLGGVVGKVGGAVGSVVGGIGDVLGFARGGEIPTGYSNDTFPARLSSGELVVDKSTNTQLKNFLANQSVLDAMLAELRKPIVVETAVQLDNREFANIVFKLNRTNARLA